MASPEVQVVSLPSTFRCVLRDRNRRQQDEDVVVLRKNLKALVKNVSDENSQNKVDSWIGNKAKKKSKSRLGSPEKQFIREDNVGRGGASSLVQIWEARLNQSNGGNSQSIENVQEIHFPAPSTESESENKSTNFDLKVESKCGGVDETIGRLSNKQKLIVGDSVETPLSEKRDFPVVTCLPRYLGRQAFSLLTHLKRNRHNELESLLERKAVSTFRGRGRIQSMLRLRSLKRGLVIQDPHRSTAESQTNRSVAGSTFLHLREKFQENIANAAMDSPRNRKVEEVMLRKNEAEPKMSYLELQEKIVTETLESTIHSPSIIHQEPRVVLENDEADKVESGKQEIQETHFLEEQETHFLEEQETPFPNEWEDQEEYEDKQSYYGESSNDWLAEISRPRTYWEDLRKSRYLEVKNGKEDICKLLERKTVSRFLQSGLREKIDNLIMSRVQTHPTKVIDAVGEDDEEGCDLSHTSSMLFERSPAGSWSSQDIVVTPTHDVVPLHDLHSTEKETISDLKSQILQLQLDMSELRDSVKTCLDVNARLQKSVHRENPLKRKCCVCNETQVETLLYRCGHICTCLKCANELQWNGGKCPICHAKILDVVRVFFDT